MKSHLCGGDYWPCTLTSAISTAAESSSRFLFTESPRELSQSDTAAHGLHPTLSTSLSGCRSNVLAAKIFCCTAISDDTKHILIGYDSKCIVYVLLVEGDEWHCDLLSTYQRQSCQVWIAVQMGRSGLNPWFRAPDPPEWHGGQIYCLCMEKEQRRRGYREEVDGVEGWSKIPTVSVCMMSAQDYDEPWNKLLTVFKSISISIPINHLQLSHKYIT